MRRILLLNQNHIGDALFTLPAIAAIRAAWPDAALVNAAPRGVGTLFTTNPHLTQNWLLDEPGILNDLRFLRQARQQRFDAVFVFASSSIWHAHRAFMAGIPVRVGFSHPSTRWAFTHRIPRSGPSQHQADDNLDLVRALTDVPASYPIELPLARDWIRDADVVLRDVDNTRPLVGLNPGATVDRKRWPIDRWAALAGRMQEGGWQPVLFGGPNDADLVRSIQAELPHPIPSLQGRLPLGPLAAAISRTRGFVSADSGPMHIAVAVGTPVVALHGPTHPVRTGPYTDRAAVIHHPDPAITAQCPTIYGTMESITVDEVQEAVRRLAGGVMHSSGA